jgi:low affinity Fe/Cu permease
MDRQLGEASGRASMKRPSRFARFAKMAAHLSGRPSTFLLAAGLIVVWLVTGPIFGFNETWQLLINTGTTIVTFLMVFLIQNTQNRDSEALHVKIDELIRSTRSARNSVLDLEELEEDELDSLRDEYEKLAQRARKEMDERTGKGRRKR